MDQKNNIDHRAIEYKAEAVLDAYDITRPVVDVLTIANGEGIRIKEVVMPPKYSGVAGFFDKNEKIIYLQSSDTPQRKLFTVAHELGHYFLGHENYSVRFRVPREDMEYSKEESEANSFAAKLLTPDSMLKDYMKKYNLGKSDYRTLASIFGVPISSIRPTLDFLK